MMEIDKFIYMVIQLNFFLTIWFIKYEKNQVISTEFPLK